LSRCTRVEFKIINFISLSQSTIAQKKALSQSWQAQRRALAKIEAAKMGQAQGEVMTQIEAAKEAIQPFRPFASVPFS